MKKKLVLIWRILFSFTLILLFVTKTIALDTFLAIVIGIIIFSGIPELFQMQQGNMDKNST